MPDQESFDMALSLSTGSVVRVADTNTGIGVQFINPLIDPDDKRQTTRTFNNEQGRNTIVWMSEESAEALMFALIERFKQKKGREVGNG